MIYKADDLKPENRGEGNYENKWVILRSSCLAEGFKDRKYQLWFCTGGFGADPVKIGVKCYGIFAADKDHDMIALRGDILGIADRNLIDEWKKAFPESSRNVDEIEKGHIADKICNVLDDMNVGHGKQDRKTEHAIEM